MFIEHIGPLIYRSLWSEMLDDRKFYFPITSKESACSGRRRRAGFGATSFANGGRWVRTRPS